jgi:hypothetical protein
MQKIVHDDEKYVEIWLTNAESQDTILRENLKPLCKEYKQKKYHVVIFTSGKGDLLTLTKDLLKHTWEVNARKEVEAEKSC